MEFIGRRIHQLQASHLMVVGSDRTAASSAVVDIDRRERRAEGEGSTDNKQTSRG